MKIFNKGEGWESKVNFVDENNVVLGYDTDQACCEHADWFIADVPTEKIPSGDIEHPSELPGWVFDTTYFREVSHVSGGTPPHEYNELDAGGMAIFRIVSGDREKFIHLFNCHNGYYAHGLDWKDGDTVLREDAL